MTQAPIARKEAFDVHLSRLAEHATVEGARVLEIGGDRWRYASNVLVDNGAAHVETINIVPGWPEGKFVAPKIYCRKLDCRELSTVYPSDSFDIIFGVAVAEHISGLDVFAREAHKVLKPNGVFYLHGGPLWTAPKGHHLFHKVADRFYKFTDKDCPIGRWEHLMTDEQGLAERMESRGVERSVAQQLANWVHTTDEQNRIGYNAQTRIFDDSPLELIDRVANAFSGPDTKQLAAIESMGHDPDDRYDASGVSHIMKRL